MFDGIGEFFAAWREIVHISEWTGLSLGALVALAALVYFVKLPIGTAIRIGLLVLTAYICLLVGETFGARDKQRQWDHARIEAAAAQKQHDTEIGIALDTKYKPQLEQIQRQAQANKDLADGYEQKMLALLAKQPASGSCRLGALAGRLHLRR